MDIIIFIYSISLRFVYFILLVRTYDNCNCPSRLN